MVDLQEKDEKLEGDAGLNKFFRDIYQSSDEDMRRAMSKSFVSISIFLFFYFSSMDTVKVLSFLIDSFAGLFTMTGGIEWDSAVDKLERSWDEDNRKHSSGWHGAQEMGDLIPSF